MPGRPFDDLLRLPFVRAVGGELQIAVEDHPNPDYVDHVWITMNAGSFGRLLVSVNTRSKWNRDAGFDPRVRVGVVRGKWEQLPARGIEASAPLDYAELERTHDIPFEHCHRLDLERMLQAVTAKAALLEAWGDPYRNRHRLGLHQIHSRRASCSVPTDLQGHDGALRFYLPRDRTTEMYLFKFCGQP